MITIDFETEAIVGNPTVRPPRPVGVAIKRVGYKARYFAWGHPTGNNCTFEEAKERVWKAIKSNEPLVFQNAKFDLAVMRKWFDVATVGDPLRVHDTMFLIYLHDPYASTFSLKPSAERILGIPPEERDAVRDWVLAHVDCKPSEWGAHIAKAPADLVGPYCIGDVVRTEKLWLHLHDKVPLEPYQREQKLLPIVMAGERRGVRLDLEHLGADLALWEKALTKADHKLRRLLGNPNVNLDSGEELADALDKAGLITSWVLTPTGRRSTARGALESSIAHPEVLGLLRYRGALSHCLSNFARPWVELGQEYNGRLHPEWNQVRQSKGGADSKGTRTGRLSCGKPNFQNPPNEYQIIVPQGFPELPLMRKYLIPDEGYVWIKRDYSQQELRILAHYSEGRLFERYQADPKIDAHVETQSLIKEFTGIDLPRKYVKITGFSMIYGSGVPALAGQLGISPHEAAGVKGAYLHALPEVSDLMEACKRQGRMGGVITTWGGRDYPAEPPKLIKGRMRSFEYKLLNYLIQGSAADCTKEALIRWDADQGRGRFLATVHDEINGQAPKDTWREDMALMRKAMESIEFDVQMLSDGYVGKSWANLERCE